MTTNHSLETLRRAFLPAMMGGLALLYCVVCATAFWQGAMPLATAGIGGALVGLVFLLAWRQGATITVRHTSSAAMMALVGLLVFTASGTQWQIDTHMAFFAFLAITAGWGCWSSILVATAVVALHHLMLNVVYPAAIFPNGADLSRVLLHAVILVVEAIALILAARRIVQALEVSEVATENATKNLNARNELEQARTLEHAVRQRRADLVDQLVRGFEGKIAGVLEIVTSAAVELDATARSMTGVADDTSQQAMASRAAAEEASVNVRTVASAADEMVASFQEIERQVQRSNAVAGDATHEAEATTASMSRLAQAAEKIGEAVTMISNIAGQTNLLALNATIEAARAGEAGRGFAVVATEVKELAGQTAQATEEISGQITAIQTASAEALTAIRQIGRTIVSVNDITGSIAATVVRQTAATNAIARNASEAARGTEDVSSNVADVLASSGETGSAAQRVLRAAGELANQSLAVKHEVDGFLAAIRAA